MNHRAWKGLFAALVMAIFPGIASAQPEISVKQDIAVFSLGYYGWNIPSQALGSIDMEIQKVFSDLGRFTILGVSQRLSSGGLEQFIATIKQAKQANFIMPDKYIFGEAFLTQAEFNKLVGAFVVVVPVVTEFNSFYNIKNLQYETTIKTGITFIDVSEGGTVIAIKTIQTSGSDKNNQQKSISSAISSIPGQLQYEVRSISQFQIKTRVLAVQGSTIRIQMGANMGIMKGDEYAILQKATVSGFDDTREVGLVVIKDVGPEVSTGEVLYSSIRLGQDTQLREIPRLGSELDLFVHYLSGPISTVLPGFRAVAARGFYGVRPFAAIQVPLSLMNNFLVWGVLPVEIFPINAILGAEYAMNMGRLSLAPSAGIGVSYYHVTSTFISTDTDFLSHIGVSANLHAAYLLNRNTKAFVDLGYEYWIAVSSFWGNTSYSGPTVGAGVTFKL